jgi:glucose/arabinose dehydrogenase
VTSTRTIAARSRDIRATRAVVALAAVAVLTAGALIDDSQVATAEGLTVSSVMSGLDHPWDVAFAADGTMFVTERSGRLLVRTTSGVVQAMSVDMSDLWVASETGLMAVEVDPDFMSNRRLYTCQGSTDGNLTVQVVAWQVATSYASATRVADPLVGGVDGTSGRHGGCQLRTDRSGALFVSTGDAATGTNPQSLDSLNGKVLRVDRFTGQGLPGNPFFAQGGNRARIYTYGHRNVQGVAIRDATGEMWSVEHGTDRDDEVNRLVPGGNYGWDPIPGYDESTPMTDLAKFPGAVRAEWSSGFPTIAPSSAAFLRGSGWGSYEGALAVSVLKDQHLRLMSFDAGGRFLGATIPPELDHVYGRLRGAELGPGGVLFVTTDNGGGQDQVLAVAPAGEGFGLAVASAPAPNLDIVTRGFDDRAWTRTWTGAWTPWLTLGGRLTSDPDASASGGDRLDVVARGTDWAVWLTTRAGGVWSGWQSIGGIATSGPTIASPGPGRLEVFARGRDGALWVDSFNGGWTGWSSLGGLLASDPDAVAVGSNRVDVVARGLDDALWLRRRVGGSWQPWQRIGGLLSSGPTITAIGDRVDIFARGRDLALYHTWSAGGGGWAPWDMGLGLLSGAPDATWRGGSLDTFQRGLDGAVWQFYWAGSGWSPAIRWG